MVLVASLCIFVDVERDANRANNGNYQARYSDDQIGVHEVTLSSEACLSVQWQER